MNDIASSLELLLAVAARTCCTLFCGLRQIAGLYDNLIASFCFFVFCCCSAVAIAKTNGKATPELVGFSMQEVASYVRQPTSAHAAVQRVSQLACRPSLLFHTRTRFTACFGVFAHPADQSVDGVGCGLR